MRNVDEDNSTTRQLLLGSTKPGILHVSGGYYGTEASLGYGEFGEEDLTEDMEDYATWTIPNIEIKNGDATCGTVVINNKKYVSTANGFDIYLGGTLTISNSITPPAGGISCSGNTVATLVITEPPAPVEP